MLVFGTQRVNERGHLEVGGCDCVELARTHGTPLYVLDEALIRQHCRRYRDGFGAHYPAQVNVAYAGKALLTQAICKLVACEGMWLDVASAGELHTALTAGFPPERILLHGNYKSEAELRMALEAGVHEIVIDNFGEIEAIGSLAEQRGQPARVAVRVAPGINVHTHTYVQTGQLDSKFGIGVNGGLAMSALRQAAEHPHLDLLGIHCHIGSQIFGIESYERAAEIMLDLMAEAAQEGLDLRELNLGGGLGARHTREDAPASIEHLAEVVCGALVDGLAERGLEPPVLALEPGRSIVDEAGLTLYTIGVVKEIPDVRTYVSVDGGLSDNPRPALYQADYEAVVANKANGNPTRRVRVSGKHCETDTLIQDVALHDPQPGDLLAVFSTGAYNYAMASNYNRFPRPAVVLVHEGQADLIVERETLDELVSHDRVPERLR